MLDYLQPHELQHAKASLSITNSWSSPKFMCIKSVMPSSHLILCRPLLLLPPIPLSIRVFSNESNILMRWPKYWSFSLRISPSNYQDWSPLGWTGWISLQSKGLTRVFSNTTVQKHQFFKSIKFMVTRGETWSEGGGYIGSLVLTCKHCYVENR